MSGQRCRGTADACDPQASSKACASELSGRCQHEHPRCDGTPKTVPPADPAPAHVTVARSAFKGQCSAVLPGIATPSKSKGGGPLPRPLLWPFLSAVLGAV